MKIFGRTKEPETKSKNEGKSQRGFFGRRKKKAPTSWTIEKEKSEEAAKAAEAKAAEDAKTAEPVVTKEPSKEGKVMEEEEKPETRTQERVVPETVESTQEEDDDIPQQPSPREDDNKTEPEEGPKDPDGDAPAKSESMTKNSNLPAEPEGRNEEAEGEPAEKNVTEHPSRDVDDELHNKEAGNTEEQTTGLLCGCI